MSIWLDMEERSLGDQIRKEDTLETVDIPDLSPNPIVYVGYIDEELANTIHRIPGNIYTVRDVVVLDDVEYYPGQILLDDGNTWHVVSQTYVGQ